MVEYLRGALFPQGHFAWSVRPEIARALLRIETEAVSDADRTAAVVVVKV